MTGATWAEARNLLCVRLDYVGDVLMTTPALRALKRSVTGRRITLLTSPAGAEVARLVPEVDGVIVYEAPWMKATPPRAGAAVDFAMVRRLEGRGFDGAVVFTTYSQSPLPAAMLCYLAAIPLRLAYCHENAYQLLTHRLPDPEPQEFVRHEVRRQLDLVASTGAVTGDESLSLAVPPRLLSEARRLLADEGLDLEKPWVLIHPGSTAPSRRYPAAAFAESAQTLGRDDGLQLVFSGAVCDTELIGRIRTLLDVPSLSLAGKTDLAQLAAVISLAPLLISNNTGPAHIAAAVKTPVVDLYAMTNPQHTPWQVPQRVLTNAVPCGYCFKSVCPLGHNACLTGIAPGAVVQAVRSLLAETRNAEVALAGA